MVEMPGVFCCAHCRRAQIEGWTEEGCSCGHAVCVGTGRDAQARGELPSMGWVGPGVCARQEK